MQVIRHHKYAMLTCWSVYKSELVYLSVHEGQQLLPLQQV